MNKKKWEEIDYEDIKVGDIIRHSIVIRPSVVCGEGAGSSVVNRGKVMEHDADDSSYKLGANQWIYPNNIYAEDYEDIWEVSIYRKIPKVVPFTLPEGLGAVARGRTASGAKLERTLVKIDEGKDRFYVVENNTIATAYEINLFYTDLVLLSEGYVEEQENTE